MIEFGDFFRKGSKIEIEVTVIVKNRFFWLRCKVLTNIT